MGDIQKMLPSRPAGHSMKELADTLSKIGLDAEGRRSDIAGLAQSGFPAIAHLQNPDHFIVVVGMDQQNVHVFDSQGRRSTRSLQTFRDQWSGNFLRVSRKNDGRALPAYRPTPRDKAPMIQFDSLFVDHGIVRATGEPVTFDFRFTNVGTADLTVKHVATGCTCLSARSPPAAIKPGAEGHIVLVYNARNRPGPFLQEAAVETNDPAFQVVKLRAGGTTDQSVETVPPYFLLGDVVAGEAGKAICFLHYRGEQDDFKVRSVSCSLDEADAKWYPASDQTKLRKWLRRAGSDLRTTPGVWCVELTIPARGAGVEPIEGTVRIATNIKGFERMLIPIAGRVVPPVRLYPSVLSFGPDAGVDRSRKIVTAVSLVSEPFRIVSAESSDSSIQCRFNQTPATTNAEIEVIKSRLRHSAGGIVQVRFEFLENKRAVVIPLQIECFSKIARSNGRM